MDVPHRFLEQETDKVATLLCGSCLLFGPGCQLVPISQAIDDGFACCLPSELPGLEDLLSSVPREMEGLERIAHTARIIHDYPWPSYVDGGAIAIRFIDRALHVGGYWAVGEINLIEERVPSNTLFDEYPTVAELIWFLRRETVQFFDQSVDTVADLEDHAPPSSEVVNRLADKARSATGPRDTCSELRVLADLVFPQVLDLGSSSYEQDRLLEVLARAVYGERGSLSFLDDLARRLAGRFDSPQTDSHVVSLLPPRDRVVPVHRWLDDRERPRPVAYVR